MLPQRTVFGTFEFDSEFFNESTRVHSSWATWALMSLPSTSTPVGGATVATTGIMASRTISMWFLWLTHAKVATGVAQVNIVIAHQSAHTHQKMQAYTNNPSIKANQKMNSRLKITPHINDLKPDIGFETEASTPTSTWGFQRVHTEPLHPSPVVALS